MKLLKEIERQNPWWRHKDVTDDTVERDIEQKIVSELSEHIVTGITGVRRCGKSTLLKRILKKLLKDIAPENILYFSFDIEKCEIRELLDKYFNEIRRTTAEDAGETFIFLDEVQKIDGWSDHVKAYYDSYEHIKFIITGSSSANIRKGSGESLVGRMSLHHLTTFSFREYLRYCDISVPEKEFGEFPVPNNADEIKTKFLDYFEIGGFPGLFNFDETTRIERLRDMIDLALYRDIVDIFDIQRPELLEGLFKVISSNSGGIVNYNNLSRDLDAEYRTIKKYIEELESSFLIGISRRFEENRLKQYRKRPKIYPGDHSFCLLENTSTGRVAETIAFNHLSTLGSCGYWKNNKNEIDVILKEQDNIYAFEIKYKEGISGRDRSGLETFSERYPESERYLVTKNELERDLKIVPLWLLLLHI